MVEPEAGSPGKRRVLAEDPGLGAAAGSSTLSLSRLLSTLSSVGAACGGTAGGSRTCRSSRSPFSLPRQIPDFTRHGFTHCGHPALGSQGEQKAREESDRPERAGVGLKRPPGPPAPGTPSVALTHPAAGRRALACADAALGAPGDGVKAARPGLQCRAGGQAGLCCCHPAWRSGERGSPPESGEDSGFGGGGGEPV